jgi:biopolymer transport protein ExbD
MAEINTSGVSGHKKGAGVNKGKKLSTRVDLTPMVDLGFLLITFFIFTTTMSQPKMMHIFLPKDVKDVDKTPVKESAVITLLLAKNNQVYYYEGKYPSTMQQTDFKKVRDIIQDKKTRTDQKYFFVVLKPSAGATYKNTVNMLDEMTIDGVKRFALVDISPVEESFIKASETLSR